MKKLAVLLLLVGCSSKPDVAVDNPRELAREALLKGGRKCFANERAYCLEELLDEALDKAADQMFKSEFPTTKRKLDRLTRRARGYYSTAQMKTEERRAKVLAKIQARFNKPEVKVEGGRVIADAGIVPTRFEKARAGWKLDAAHPLVDRGHLAGPELARVLLKLREAHPSATRVDLKLKVPGGSSLNKVRYSWFVSREQLGVYRRMNPWATREPLGPRLEKLLDGSVSISQGLLSCAVGDDGTTLEGCPPP